MTLLLKNLVWQDNLERKSGDVRVAKGIIKQIGSPLLPDRKDIVIELGDHFLYRGLINAHDHLEMNLYGPMGSPPYQNYFEWAKDIYRPKESPVREIEKVDIRHRLLWGGLKNLVSGATTVIHHNPWHRRLAKNDFPVRVLKRMRWAHSLGFEPDLQKRFRPDEPFVIHAGEGTDSIAQAEIPALDRAGLLKTNTAVVHGVGLDDDGIARMVNQQSALIWCPASNMFLFGKTAPIDRIIGRIPIAIGTDSTMTGCSTLLEEMHIAKKCYALKPTQIYDMVSNIPASIFQLPATQIAAGAPADLLILPRASEDYYKNLLQGSADKVSMVVVNGNIQLIDERLYRKDTGTPYAARVFGSKKYTRLNVAALKQVIHDQAGMDIVRRNPLWHQID
jgi:cytosine/adenosine deaminase-related metal-dependent hydrolase